MPSIQPRPTPPQYSATAAHRTQRCTPGQWSGSRGRWHNAAACACREARSRSRSKDVQASMPAIRRRSRRGCPRHKRHRRGWSVPSATSRPRSRHRAPGRRRPKAARRMRSGAIPSRVYAEWFLPLADRFPSRPTSPAVPLRRRTSRRGWPEAYRESWHWRGRSPHWSAGSLRSLHRYRHSVARRHGW